ncbi:allophanate hydrolase [Psychroflexus salinarum]|uniref:Allophanate hydrolase n=1 Tax=Psychroflexus salinarum TaxID=546024 RepID=A0ABW3GWL7_9FLAO
MSVIVKQSGLYATIQDEGRSEGMPQGIPISGAMDLHLYRFANQVLENKENSACIEFYQQGLKLEFDSPIFICVAVLGGVILLNDKKIETKSIIKINSGDQLTIKQLTEGNWGYISVKDGFESSTFLGSKSFYKALTQYQLQKNDKIDYKTFDGESGGDCPKLNIDYYKNLFLDVFKGPEFHKLSQTLQYQLLNAEFSLSTSLNRMAYEIQERLENKLEEIVTGPVLPGTIQYTPEGKMLVLMRDAQVTGGYPRILQLSEKAINLISQMKVKSKFKFNLIEINSEKI